MLDWKIHYADGTTFSDKDGTWEDAPQDNLVAVPVRDGLHGRVVLHGLDYFYRVLGGGPTEIAHCHGITAQLHLRCPWLKFGTQTNNENFRKILNRATNDPDFPLATTPRRRSEDGRK